MVKTLAENGDDHAIVTFDFEHLKRVGSVFSDPRLMNSTAVFPKKTPDPSVGAHYSGAGPLWTRTSVFRGV